MDVARWQRLEALFHEARGLGASERRAFLEARGADEGDLIDEVEAMLLAADPSSAEIGGIVDSAILGALEQLPHGIGPYEVVSRIGTGGFCSVYLARLPRQPATEVAVKVLRRGLATPQSERRLRQESEILARLHHPNIARLLGHGTSGLGEPYVVMEPIDGEPIDRFCDRQRWTLDQRLTLFRQVCSAVEYAHANLVIHRDIKPSNLLVTADGTPKLLDFGIAKLLRPEVSRAEPVQTVAGNSLMTPDFASPEQVREEPLTTATDVYSLGVLLYRLLCGRPPYRFPSRSPRAVEEVICHAEPVAPSARLTRQPSMAECPEGDVGADEVARCRQLSVQQLRGRLRGDLDSIVLMALGKRPDERYASALELSQDIGRHLNSLPVSAHRITAFYRARKFVRRHRFAVAFAAAILVILSTAVIVTTRATLRAEAERNRAEGHLAEAQQVTDFLVEIFEVPDPEIAQGRNITAKELLDEGAQRIVTQLQHQPERRSSLMTTMGRVYRNLGDHRKSRELLQEALEHRRRRYPDADPLVIETQQELARSLLAQGDYEAAQELLLATRTTMQGVGETTSATYALTLSLLAAAGKQMNRLHEAEALAQQALEIQRVLLPPTDPELIESLSKLAEVMSLKRDFEAAEQIFRETLELRRSDLGGMHPDVATNLGNLAVVLHGQGRLEAAEQAAREVVRIRAALYGDDHWLVGTGYNNLSQILAARGQVDEALPWMEKSVAIGQARLGEEHPKVVGSLVNLALMYRRIDRLHEAEDLYLRALELHRRTLGEQHPSTARNLFKLAELYAAQGRRREALPLLNQVISSMAGSMPEGDYRLSHPLLLRGRIYREMDDCDQALPSLRQALELRRQQYPGGDPAQPQVKAVAAEIELCVASES